MPSKVREQDEDISVDSAPTSINPYAVLALPRDAPPEQIKSAYRKAALQHHPDKAIPNSKDAAHAKFHEIAFAYAILSDERRRRRYDTTGRTEESLELDGEDGEEFDWTTFFRQQYADVVTEEKIREFESEYKGSEEERGHVLKAYVKFEGSMDKLYQDVMLSDVLEDDERFRSIIDEALQNGEVEGYRKYVNESEKSKKSRMTNAHKRRETEAREAVKAGRELEDEGKSNGKKSDAGMGDLAALIQQRQTGRAENFFDSLEAKYAPNGKKGAGTKRTMDEPPEKAFAENRTAKVEGGDAVDGARKSKRSKR